MFTRFILHALKSVYSSKPFTTKQKTTSKWSEKLDQLQKDIVTKQRLSKVNESIKDRVVFPTRIADAKKYLANAVVDGDSDTLKEHLKNAWIAAENYYNGLGTHPNFNEWFAEYKKNN